MEDTPPQIDGLKLTDRLGEGAWGEVFAGQRLTDGQPVAVKVLRERLSRDAVAVKRMLQEGRICWSLDHPNVIRVLGWGQEPGGRVYIVMELLHGESLEQRVAREGALPPVGVLSVAQGLAAGLKAIHRRAVHRDIKPSNIFLCDNQLDAAAVRILDLGIAFLPVDDPQRIVITEQGEVVGTPAYAAPERFRGGAADPRTDIYSFGATLHEALTGQPPFAGTPLSIAVKVCQARVAPPIQRAEVPEPLRALVARMLHPNPESRPATMDEVVATLERISAAIEITSWTATHRVRGTPPTTVDPQAGADAAFMAAVIATVHEHYHPDFVPDEIRRRLTQIGALTRALDEARQVRETAQAEAAMLACKLEGDVQSLATRVTSAEAEVEAARAALEELRAGRDALLAETRELDREYEARCQEFTQLYRSATETADFLGEPVAASSAHGRAAQKAMERIDAVAARRANNGGQLRELQARLDSTTSRLSAASFKLSEARRAQAGVEVERTVTLPLREHVARDRAAVAERVLHDRQMAFLDLSVCLQRMIFG